MRREHLLGLLILSQAAVARAEDAAHRADRLRTEQLNRRALAATERRDVGNAKVRRSNADAMDDYQRKLAAWRKRYDACLDGDYSACDR
ncbi:hypothetical protein [Sphingomonas montanisoli]|uniref:Uncharacterized protein n=1 Tax=Sphingomonas montanisoli TaxID=2606412 RepID=A0A5D9CC53_9SPHN|nr:hypothetical protein [Sphingomonas montanisoli]TZG28702.1 hypothetical protein FYJ91_00700 [Sphingomonas montanisoli]